MHKLSQICTKFRPYRLILLLAILVVVLLIILLIITFKMTFFHGQHSTIISSSTPSSTDQSCQMSTTISSIACGCPMISNVKIINGQPANRSAWPWMISYGPKRIHICGGTLITPEYILTAAHCFHSNDADNPIDLSSIEIRIGLTDLLDVTRENLFSIRKVILHDHFNSNTYQNDLALIRLDRLVHRSDNIQMLCLPRLTSHVYPPVDSIVIAIGWGHTVDPLMDPNSVTPTHLQQTILPVLPIVNNRCFEQEISSSDEQFCAGYANGLSDTCQADSGSPLMYFNVQEHHWELVGIVSYGIGCGQEMYPGVYTRISAYLDWIHDHLGY